MKMKNARLIHTEKEYDEIMHKVLALAKTNPGEETPEYEELILLSMLIEEYDRKHYPKPPADPVEAIKFRMEQMDLRPIDMKRYFGSTGRYYDIINKKRGLSVNMIRRLHSELNIPYESLMA